MLDLDTLEDLEQRSDHQQYSCMWRPQLTKGNGPGPVSHHSSVFYNNKIYVFGGNKVKDLTSDDKNVFELDIGKLQWTMLQNASKVSPNIRDEHTAIVYNDCMYIFGGFESGVRTNTTWMFDFATRAWT